MDARKERFAKSDLKKVFADASRVIAARGKKSETFDMKSVSPGSVEFAKAVLGPTGNLRAPVLKMGKTWLVGFGQPAWEDYFG